MPVWQPDEDVTDCFLCHCKFTLFFRRHHCRRCGKVVCGECSLSRTLYEDGLPVVCSPNDLFPESMSTPHRTCDFCMEEMISEGVMTNQTRPDPASRPMEVPPRRHIKDSVEQRSATVEERDDSSESERCPICGISLEAKAEREREDHISTCLTNAEFSGSPDQPRLSNRMLVYCMPFPDENKKVVMSCSDASNSSLLVSPPSNEKFPPLEECVICLEDMKPGDKVGRLECLCVFHYKCIKCWFKQRGPGECPVHAVHA